jgi:hypothetical protein
MLDTSWGLLWAWLWFDLGLTWDWLELVFAWLGLDLGLTFAMTLTLYWLGLVLGLTFAMTWLRIDLGLTWAWLGLDFRCVIDLLRLCLPWISSMFGIPHKYNSAWHANSRFGFLVPKYLTWTNVQMAFNDYNTSGDRRLIQTLHILFHFLTPSDLVVQNKNLTTFSGTTHNTISLTDQVNLV